MNRIIGSLQGNMYIPLTEVYKYTMGVYKGHGLCLHKEVIILKLIY